jgi:hypothetical protein
MILLMTRTWRLPLILVVSLLVFSLISAAQSSKFDQRAAKKVSDFFMADLVANRVSDAIQKLKSSSAKSTQGESEIVSKMLDSCGQPLDAKSKNNGVMGKGTPAPGRAIPAITFLYLCKRSDQKDTVFT